MIFVNFIELRNRKWNNKKVSFNCALPVFMGSCSVRRTNGQRFLAKHVYSQWVQDVNKIMNSYYFSIKYYFFE